MDLTFIFGNSFSNFILLFLEQLLQQIMFAATLVLEESHDGGGGHAAAEHAPLMNPWLMFALAMVLVALNGFFVAAEFALVKIRVSQIDKMVAEKKICLLYTSPSPRDRG